MAKQLTDQAREERLHQVLSRRLTTSANILCRRKGIKVAVKNLTSWQPPSWWDEKNSAVTINRANPPTSGPEQAFLYDKAKFYHELAHVRETGDSKLRHKCLMQANDPQFYLDLSNVLEDGRIEVLMRDRLPGCAPYLDYINAEFAKVSPQSRLMALAYRVRFGRYQDSANYWTPHEADIQVALKASTAAPVWEAALRIVNKMVPQKKPNPTGDLPEPGQTCYAPADEDMVSTGDSSPKPPGEEDSDEDEDGQSQKVVTVIEAPDEDEEEGESDAKPGEETDGEEAAGTDPATGSGADGSESDGDEAGDADDEPTGDAEPGSGGEEAGGAEVKDGQVPSATPDDRTELNVPREAVDQTTPEEAAANVDAIRDAALAAVKAELAAELKDIMVEVDNPPREPQQFRWNKESHLADQVHRTIESIRVDQHRQRWTPSRRHGALDSRRLIGVFTGDTFLRVRAVQHGLKFACAIVVDASGSMMGGNETSPINLTLAAARAITAALERNETPILTCLFDRKVKAYPAVPMRADMTDGWGGGTDTHLGLQAAHKWLTDQSVDRRLVLVITDGQPTSSIQDLMKAKNDLTALGARVVSLQLGMNPPTIQATATDMMTGLDAYCHDALWAPDFNDVGRILEDYLTSYAMEA